MSRNLRGGVQKGFNFAFSDDDDSPSPQRDKRSLDDEEDQDSPEGNKREINTGNFNLLLQRNQSNKNPDNGIKNSKLKKPSALQMGFDEDSPVNLPSQAKRSNKPSQLIMDDNSDEENSDTHHEEETKLTTNSTALPAESSTNLDKENELHAATGATGATNEMEVDEPDSSE